MEESAQLNNGSVRHIPYKSFHKCSCTEETLIGYHPDAAASFYLPRLPGHLERLIFGGPAEYLNLNMALTGDKINGAEMMFCGLATHYSQSACSILESEASKTQDPWCISTLKKLQYASVFKGLKGVRARVVDKDFKPKWDPPSLELVTKDMVDQYFTRLTPLEPDLELPTEKREAI
ncbi:hypothetical protein Leryth_017474 [Lithospermum erythrorhizon]|nr:hypothetical protein Leryth_017474 [Lithospermum erythrorhizon]